MFDFLSPSDPSVIIECSQHTGCTVAHSILSTLLIFFILLTGFAYTTVLERRFIAWIQDRIGPNRVGPLGLLQPVADGIKLIFKQDIMPLNADRAVYTLAPAIKVIPTLIVLAVVPLGPPIVIPWLDGNWYRVAQGLADTNVGILWILAITSISVYGVTMAGWASANKYSMIGSLRSSASMISYEIPLSMSLGIAAMMAGSLSVGDIVEAQGGNGIFNWFIFQNPLAAGLLFIALLAEVNRAPFDLPEAEQELVAGHMTEYSGMKFAMFFMAEYISMIGISVIFASAYLGGYHFLFVDQIPVLGPVWLILKVVGLLAFMVWIRSALPRIRYDRLMTLGWKVMIPLAMLAFAWSAVLLVIQEETTNNLYYLIPTAVLGTMTIIGISWFALKGQPDTVARPANEVEVVPVGGHGIGFIILQLVGSLISVPFLLHQYTIETVQNARNALSSEKPK
jgi:NADH-quinone oxidoreductase subunit H